MFLYPSTVNLYVEFTLHVSQERINVPQCKSRVVALKENTLVINMTQWTLCISHGLNRRRYRCDVEHSSQLVEYTLDVFGVHFQDRKLSSNGQASISTIREYLPVSSPHLLYKKGGSRKNMHIITFAHPPSICSSNCEMKFKMYSSRKVVQINEPSQRVCVWRFACDFCHKPFKYVFPASSTSCI